MGDSFRPEADIQSIPAHSHFAARKSRVLLQRDPILSGAFIVAWGRPSQAFGEKLKIHDLGSALWARSDLELLSRDSPE